MSFNYKNLTPFKWCVIENFPFIEADFDAITNYQLFGKVVEYLNKTIDSTNILGQKVQEFATYFENLNVQSEINNKLDEMASTGQLTILLEPYLTQYKNEVLNYKNQVNDFSQEIETLNNRVSNIISNEESSDGNTELIDIRTEFNGTIAPTAGDAVRQQAQGLSNGSLIENQAITKRTLSNDIYIDDEISQGNVTFESPNNNTYFIAYFKPNNYNISGEFQVKVKLKGILEYTKNTRLIITKGVSTTGTGTFLTNELIPEGEFEIEHTLTLDQYTPFIGLLFQSSVGSFGTFEKLFKINKPIVEINDIIAMNPENIYLFANAKNSNYKYIVTGTKGAVSKEELAEYIKKESTEIVTHNKIIVSTALELKNALNSIATKSNNNIANKNNVYDIYLNSGTYEMYPLIDKTNLQDQVLFKRGIEIPDYVNLIGIGDVTISCTIPETYEGEQIKIISTLNTYGENIFENITIIANNCRYCVHDDDGGPFKDRKILFKNCTLIHNNCNRNYWPSPECYGAGYTGGRKGEFKNCIFKNESFLPFYIHNSSPYYMTDKMDVLIENCVFDTTYENSIDLQDAYNSLTGNIVINNSILKSKLLTRGTNKFNIFGGGNNNFTFNNTNNSNNYLI